MCARSQVEDSLSLGDSSTLLDVVLGVRCLGSKRLAIGRGLWCVSSKFHTWARKKLRMMGFG